jgi:PAS domain S-box-containing protein
LLDTAPEARFDALTRTACRLFGVPTALISLVDAHRQWFKSRVGLEVSETPRDVSFCGHTILGDRALAVEDASRDERFADNPLVAGELHLRFYAGQPLRTADGLPVGTLCLIDYTPRIFTAEERAALEDLAVLAESEIIALGTHLSDAGQLRSMLGAMTEGLVIQNAAGVIVSSNPAAERILGLTKDQLEGRRSVDPRWRAIHEDGSPWPGESHPAMKALQSQQPQLGQVMGVHKPDGALTWIFINSLPMRNGSGKVQGASTTFLDITALKTQSAEHARQEVALRESEVRYRTMAENVPGVIYQFQVWPDGRMAFPFISSGVERIYGLTVEAWRAQPSFAIDSILPEDQAAYLAAYADAVARMGTFQWEGRSHTNRPGEVIWIRAQSQPTPLQDGSILWHGVLTDVTQLRLQESQIAVQGAFSQSLLESALVSIISTDLQGLVTSFNPTASEVLGWTPEEVIGRETPALWHDPEEVVARAAELSIELGRPILPGFEAFVAHAREGGRDQREWTFISRTRERIPVLLSVSAMRDGDGVLMGFLGIATDLRGSKAREIALRESEARFRLLAERTTDMIARHAPDGSFQFITPSVTAILGYTPEELLGRLPTLFLVEEDVPVMRAAHIGLLRGRQMEPFRFRARHKDDGRVVWLEAAGNSVLDPGTGAVAETIITSRDITERVRGEEALRDSEFRSRALIQALPDLIFVVHRDGTQLEVYAKEGHNLRRPVAEMLGMNLREVMPAELVEERLARIRRVLDTGQMEIYEAQVGEGDQRQDHETRVVPCGYDRVMLIVRDITERKALDRLKGEFVSTVSHELRTPLTAIRGALGLLLGGVAGDLTPQVNDLLAMGQKNVERLVLLINDLLDLEKLDKGQIAFVSRDADLEGLLASALEGLQPMADGLGVTLALRAEQPGLRAWVDPDRLAQVVVNLVGNALKFSPGKDHVEVRLSRQGEWARLEVEDHGPGIPDAFRARIFQRFAQADGTDTREKGGTGLGLSIAKGFVERMGGSLAYDSRPGLTVFRVDLPAAPLPPLKFPPEHPMEQG